VVRSRRAAPRGRERRREAQRYGSYASSIISQDGPAESVAGPVLERVAFSQSDRLRRRTSFSSMAGTSEVGSAYDYKSQDDAADMDDMKSQYAATQSGVTAY